MAPILNVTRIHLWSIAGYIWHRSDTDKSKLTPNSLKCAQTKPVQFHLADKKKASTHFMLTGLALTPNKAKTNAKVAETPTDNHVINQ